MAEAEYAFLTGLTGFGNSNTKWLFFQEKGFRGTT
jgi:hypothetical protein